MSGERKRYDCLLLILLFVIQGVVFRRFYLREIAWCVPANFDQGGNLFRSYEAQEYVLKHGILSLPGLFWDSATKLPRGCALQFEGALTALIIGGARFPRLLFNLLVFLAWQAFAFATAKRIGSSLAFGMAIVGLILCQHTVWFWAGGLFDFRIDFFACCVYGMWTCAVVRSEVFLNRAWALGAGALGAWLVLNRFLTLVYLTGVCIPLAVLFAVAWGLNRANPARRLRMSRRLVNLFFSSAIILAIAGPVLWVDRSNILRYYGVGHITGPERFIRLKEQGVTTTWDFLKYYPNSIHYDHLGKTFIFAAGLLLVAGLLSAAVSPRAATPDSDRHTRGLQILFLLMCIVVPVAALTADVSKSPVVGGIVCGPIALLITLLLIWLSRSAPPIAALIPRLAAAVVLILGVQYTIHQSNQKIDSDDYRRDKLAIADMGEWMTRFSVDQHWQQPRVSFDLISSDLNTGAFSCIGYERTGRLVKFTPLLGHGIFKITREEAMADIAGSDFVILTTTPKVGPYPFYEGLREYEGDLVAEADRTMAVARRVSLRGEKVTLYVRPTAKAASPKQSANPAP
jgi:hypothetical protein